MNTDSRPLLALAWMLGAVASFSAMAVGGREIAETLDTFEIMLYRSVIGLVIVSAILASRPGGLAQINTAHKGLHLQRNLIHFAGQNLWFYGVVLIPLAEFISLEFTNPLWVAVLAPLMLGEKITPPRIIAAILGFVGILIVARPGTSALELGHVAALGAAICFALNTIFTKRLMQFDGVLCVMFWMTLMQAGFSLITALPGGIPIPAGEEWIWVILLGVCGLSAHVCLSSALACAPATIVAPMEFIRLPVLTFIGYLLYNESLVIWVVLGAALIIAGNLLNILSEPRKSATS